CHFSQREIVDVWLSVDRRKAVAGHVPGREAAVLDQPCRVGVVHSRRDDQLVLLQQLPQLSTAGHFVVPPGVTLFFVSLQFARPDGAMSSYGGYADVVGCNAIIAFWRWPC